MNRLHEWQPRPGRWHRGSTQPRTLHARGLPAALLFGLVGLVGHLAPVAAQAPPAPESTPPPAAPGMAEKILDRLTFHAYVNQAYAISDHHQVFGIPTGGTTDYRTVAIQFRYALTKADTILVQLGNFRYGDSPINKLHSDVELEFGFYQHVFADSTTVQAGKMPLPLGIYNEIRDVGTLLPFYAPPTNMYLETFSSRNLEGLMVSRSFARSSAWSVDADLYGGGWRLPEERQATGVLADSRTENAIGTEVWLNTPLSGLRLGAGYCHFDAKKGLFQVKTLDPHWLVHASVDASFEGFYFRSELIESRTPDRLAPRLVAPKLTYRAYYGQAGVNLTPQFSVNLQADFSAVDIGLGAGYSDLNVDYALSLVYKLRPNLVVKVEGHRNRGSMVELEPSTNRTRTNYGIASLAASF
jgi:hypothetical protein